MEQKIIFDAILTGPSKEEYRELCEINHLQYNEDDFQKYKQYFHRKQLRPFDSLLDCDYRLNFEKLEADSTKEVINDDSYRPQKIRSGFVSYRSPKSIEELKRLKDKELLTFLNNWDDEHRDKNDHLIKVNISALADVFETIFKDVIISNSGRLEFWISHRNNIARPIYVARMVNTMKELVESNALSHLDQWMEFCAWVLSHPDSERIDGQPRPSSKSRDNPDWGSPRRAVVDFIDGCLKEGVDAPVSARDGLAGLLEQLCNQPDWRLDHAESVILNKDEPYTEAINNTRSRALESLIEFGFWIRRYLPDDPGPEVTDILSRRLTIDAEFTLTRPERVMLAVQFWQALLSQ